MVAESENEVRDDVVDNRDESPDVETEAAESSEGEEVSEPAEKEEKEPEAYKPDFKYSVKDKTLEFEEWVKPLVTSKEVEDKIRDMYTKVSGLPEIKQSRESLQAQHQEISAKYQQQSEALQHLAGFVQKNDLDSFFEALQIPPEAVFKWALAHAERTPEQAQAYTQQRQAQQQAYWAQQHNTTMQNQMRQMNAQMRGQMLDMVLYRPEVSAAAKAFDERVGRQGAFRDEVVKRDILNMHTNKGATPDQAVNDIITLIGYQVQAQQAQQGGNGNAAAPKPTLPNIKASSKSPVGKVPRSTDDLRRMAKAMQEQE